MESWDAIVIGGGVSGLCAATILAAAKKRVLVLERLGQIGGRATTHHQQIEGEEYRMDYGSFHAITMADRGALGVVYEQGPGLDKLRLGSLQEGMTLFRAGRWLPMKELIQGADRDDFKRIVNSMAAMSYQEAEQWDNVSFDYWIRTLTNRQNVYDFFRAVVWVLATIPYPEEISAGEMIVTMKMSMDCLHRLSSGTFGVGGSINLVGPLAEYIKANGGEVRTGKKIGKILSKAGEITGVAIEQSVAGMDYHYPDTEVIKAPIVVCSLPIWDLFEYISEEVFPEWFVNIVRSYKSPLPFSDSTIGTNFIMAEPVLKDTYHRVAFELPISKLPHQCSVVSASDPTVAPPGREWISAAGGYLRESVRRDRSKIEAAFEAMEEDFKLIYPEIYQGRILAKRRRFILVTDGLRRSPFYTGRHRLPHRAPGVGGLFFTGDTVQSRGVGIDMAARSGILCAGAVLEREIPTFRPNK